MFGSCIFQESFLISGVMCYKGCGQTTAYFLLKCFEEIKQEGLVPDDAHLIIDAEPQALGIHRIILNIKTSKYVKEKCSAEQQTKLLAKFKDKMKDKLNAADSELMILEDSALEQKKKRRDNWLYLLLNVFAMASILLVFFIFPPSILLTAGLGLVSFVTTAFTAKKYLLQLFSNFSAKNFANMGTTVSLGWFLALSHAVYHAIMMPLMGAISMVFMAFIMPLVLIALINIMDEIKEQVIDKSKKIYLQGIKTLFPEMADEYECYEFSPEESKQLQILVGANKYEGLFLNSIRNKIASQAFSVQKKNCLDAGCLIQVKSGQCFPVDCILIDSENEGETFIDAAVLTGERKKLKKRFDAIPAGAINEGVEVTVWARLGSYDSTINQILFPANREIHVTDAKKNKANKSNVYSKNNLFTYFYTGLIILGILVSLIAPIVFGVYTVSLLLQNIMGILFSICPCTLALAYELPLTLSMHQRGQRGIRIRDGSLTTEKERMHTVVFDKTGTLTTALCEIESMQDVSQAMEQRVYLLEKYYGRQHVLATAIVHDYESKHQSGEILIKDIKKETVSRTSRGLSAVVQGKKLHIGSADYFRALGLPLALASPAKIAQGFSPMYIAEETTTHQFATAIYYMKHQMRPGVLDTLNQMKKRGLHLLLATGDGLDATLGWNEQIGHIFDPKDIHAGLTPEDKELLMMRLMRSENPEGICYVGDGLNDGPCISEVLYKGGRTYAPSFKTKAAFFADTSLNGSLDYILHHQKLDQEVKKIRVQNQLLLAYSALIFIAFVISFSFVGIAVSPIIALIIMATTTLFTLFNSVRSALLVDEALDKKKSWLRQLFASDLSISLLIGSSFLLTSSVLIATIMTGGLALPAFAFTAGAVLAVGSCCLIGAIVLVGVFLMMAGAYLCQHLYEKYQGGQVPEVDAENLARASNNPLEHWRPKGADLSPVKNTEPRNEINNSMNAAFSPSCP